MSSWINSLHYCCLLFCMQTVSKGKLWISEQIHEISSILKRPQLSWYILLHFYQRKKKICTSFIFFYLYSNFNHYPMLYLNQYYKFLNCYTIILQLLGERGTVKTIDRSIVHYWLVTWQMTSRNVIYPDVNYEYRRIVDSVSVI